MKIIDPYFGAKQALTAYDVGAFYTVAVQLHC